MTEERKWENRSPAEQAVIDKLWQLKQAFKPYAAYCTATQDLTLEHFTGRHSRTGPIMEPVSVKAGQTLRICMISRLGDFGLTEKLEAETGYGLRVDWDSTLIRDVREQP